MFFIYLLHRWCLGFLIGYACYIPSAPLVLAFYCSHILFLVILKSCKSWFRQVINTLHIPPIRVCKVFGIIVSHRMKFSNNTLRRSEERNPQNHDEYQAHLALIRTCNLSCSPKRITPKYVPTTTRKY